jgi:hypothetical protein
MAALGLGDTTRVRKNVVRKTIDYNSSVIRQIEVRSRIDVLRNCWIAE